MQVKIPSGEVNVRKEWNMATSLCNLTVGLLLGRSCCYCRCSLRRARQCFCRSGKASEGKEAEISLLSKRMSDPCERSAKSTSRATLKLVHTQCAARGFSLVAPGGEYSATNYRSSTVVDDKWSARQEVSHKKNCCATLSLLFAVGGGNNSKRPVLVLVFTQEGFCTARARLPAVGPKRERARKFPQRTILRAAAGRFTLKFQCFREVFLSTFLRPVDVAIAGSTRTLSEATSHAFACDLVTRRLVLEKTWRGQSK